MKDRAAIARPVLSWIPPFGRWLAERDALRLENEILKRDLRVSKGEVNELQYQWQVASDELQRIKAALVPTYVGSDTLFVPPGHFYSPIPAWQDIRANEDTVFGIPSSIRGIELNDAEQLELMVSFVRLYSEQPFSATPTPDRRFHFQNVNFTYPDAITLYCMLRQFRPRRFVEIGSGCSSCAVLDVNEHFFNDSIACTFVDPYPRLLRSLLRDSDRDRIRILAERVQEVDLGIFQELRASDILFIDSSHISKTGSDVNYLLFEVLPLLAEGVFIHFHDIFYPFEYPREWVFEGRAWNEAYLLRAFLQYNKAFKVRFFTSYLIHKHREAFESDMPLFLKNPAGSLWLEKTAVDFQLERVDALSPAITRPLPKKIDPSNARHFWLLGTGWHQSEGDHCWMDSEASFRIAGPNSPAETLSIRAFSPHQTGARVSVQADEFPLGIKEIETSGGVDVRFALPSGLVGRSSVVIHVSIDRVHRAAGDSRMLGLSVAEIEIG